MNRLKIDNFKAYPKSTIAGEPYLTLDISKNVLLYGENGAGKSSIYQALNVFFYEDKLDASINNSGRPEPEVLQLKKEFWNKYRHRGTPPTSDSSVVKDFSVEVVDENGTVVDKNEYKVFMLDMKAIGHQAGEQWLLSEKLKKAYFPIEEDDVNDFCEEHKKDIEEKVNEKLEDFLEKSLVYTLDQSKDYCLGLADTDRKIAQEQQDIYRYFNEAKINLVILLTYFSAIEACAKELPATDNKVLVLDDFVTSLDTANRVFIIQHLLTTFPDFRIIVLTHNINFYNLFKYTVCDIYKMNEYWNFVNLYNCNNSIRSYYKGSTKTVKQIKELQSRNTPPADIAVLIRKRFEVLVHQFSKLLMIDYAEDNKTILNRMINAENVYIRDRNSGANKLVDDILAKIGTDTSISRTDLLEEIEGYKWEEYNEFREVLRELKLYKKLVMNPMSHGTTSTQAPTSSTAIEKSLILLDKLESQLKSFIDKNVIGET